MLSIGEFSHLTHLSVRTLRRFHDAGLLEPARVDDASGYRYYTVDQIPTAQVIHRLRELDVPLGDVQRILRSPDPAVRAELVADHLRRLESQLDRTRAAVASLQRLLRPEPAGLEVHPVTLPAAELAVTTHVGEHHDIDVTYGRLGTWVVDNALAWGDTVREIYLVGPHDTDDPSAWRTEIGWPVLRVASG